MRAWGLLGMLMVCGACASGPEAPRGPPSVTLAPGWPVPAQGRHYADCIAQAVEAGQYDREPEANLLRFTCTGDKARAFYDALGPWSDQIGSRLDGEGRSWRSSVRIQRDLSGVDHCSADNAGDYRCVVVLNVGDFLDWTGEVNAAH